ncbi:TIGR03986 family type III CRISPR-associated RAMP protein [Roseospira goensis]|uniref:CRISPR-associated protein (TIGR03986 family) n=1 Tax=Roseospira goensis TaxID=391922 RepID=A0A7W6WKG4_9PROT|nr:TIGR03986 family CRISPR-associated RAMP protein [Roseospira goensis]MBB4285422.1 CRISPR-associated protein (TIGR03986 family) [Roseospira goensis]
MTLSPDLIEKAVALLETFSNMPSLEDAMDHLSEAYELSEADLEELARRAISRLSAPQQARPARSGHRERRTLNADVGAPFRFVTLNDIVAPRDTDAGALDKPIPGGLSAHIEVQWIAETPLLIGVKNARGITEPMTLGPDGPPVIPGASLRGMVRAATEIVAMARLGSANLHHKYGLRDFEHPTYGQDLPVSDVDQVKAGWLTLRWDNDVARKTPENASWEIASIGHEWSHIPVDDLGAVVGSAFTDRANWIQTSLEEKYDHLGMTRSHGHDTLFDFDRTVSVSHPRKEETGNRRMVHPGGPVEGVVVCSDKLPGSGGNKKLEYVFHGRPEPGVALSPEVVETFLRLSCKPSRNKPEPDGSFKKLLPTLMRGHRVPVFFVGDLNRQDDSFFFGLTRLFKVPHRYSVGDILARQKAHTEGRVNKRDGTVVAYNADFVEHLFGYVVEREDLGLDETDRIDPNLAGRKGRVAFSFATLEPGQTHRLSGEVRAAMMAPRASFAPFYLRGQAELDYSYPNDVRLAGRKRYLPRFPEGRTQEAMAAIEGMADRQRAQIQGARSSEIFSKMRFLVPGPGRTDLRFRSRIRMHNVTAAELGAVLFALTHGGDRSKPCRHMLGHARPFGAGQIRVGRVRLVVDPNDADAAKHCCEPAGPDDLMSEDGRTGFCPPHTDQRPSHALRPFLAAFTAFMRRSRASNGAGVPRFPDVPEIREFVGASMPEVTARIGQAPLDYMRLTSFNAIRKATKPREDQTRPAAITPANGAAPVPSVRDRLLPAPPAEVPAVPTSPKGVSTKG